MVSTSENSDWPSTLRIISAQISSGIDSTMSTARDSSASTQRPVTAATRPIVMPMAKDSMRRDEGDADGHAGAVDEAGEHVPADLVGAEPGGRGGGVPAPAHHLGLAVGGQIGAGQRHGDVEEDDEEAQEGGRRRLVAEERHGLLLSGDGAGAG